MTSRLRAWWADFAVVVLGVATFADCTHVGWPEPLLGVATIAWVGAMLLRSRHPLAPLAFPLVSVACLLAGAPHERFRTWFIAWLVAIWLVGVQAARWRALVIAAVVFTACGAAMASWGLGSNPLADGVAVALTTYAALLLATLVGRYARRASSARQRLRDEELQSDQRARDAADRERTRIARELHDVIGHGVTVMTVQSGAARTLLAVGDSDRARAALLEVEEAGRATLAEMRRLMGLLRRDRALEPDGT